MQTSRSVARDFFGAAHIMKIYGHIKSGNCYKVYLTAELLGLRYDWITLDNSKGETQTAEFLAINPNGKVPAMVLPDGRRLAESNAIIAFLADGSHLIPQDRFEYAQMLQWMFFEQYSHEPYIAVARFIQFYQNMPAERQAEYDTCQIKGNATLRLMDHHLSTRPYFVGTSMSLADIALFAYTHVADQGGFDLSQFPHIQDWIKRIQATPKFAPMLFDD